MEAYQGDCQRFYHLEDSQFQLFLSAVSNGEVPGFRGLIPWSGVVLSYTTHTSSDIPTVTKRVPLLDTKHMNIKHERDIFF